MAETIGTSVAPLSVQDVPLPLPPPGKYGWPWVTEESTVLLPANMPEGSGWPKITVVTPSFNQASFIEETIRSVLLQGYPNLEYFVLDGGSTDGSVEIIRKYSPWLNYWVSRPDGGQSAAINSGIYLGSGDIATWLNSDDFYKPRALESAALAMAADPQCVVVFGRAIWLGADGRRHGEPLSQPFTRQHMLHHSNAIPQSSSFFLREAFVRIGGLDEHLHYALDYDLWLKLDLLGSFIYIPEILSGAHVYADAKTSSGAIRYYQELKMVAETHGGAGLPSGFVTRLIDIDIPKLIDDYLDGDVRKAKIELARLLDFLPYDLPSSYWASIISQKTWARTGGLTGQPQTALNDAELICAQLPENLVGAREVGRQVRARLETAWVFYSDARFDRKGVYYHSWQTIKYQPKNIFNRGLWATAIKIALPEKHEVSWPKGADLKQRIIANLERQRYLSDDPSRCLFSDLPAENQYAASCYAALTLFLIDGLSTLTPDDLGRWKEYLQQAQNPETGLFDSSFALSPRLKFETLECTYLGISALEALGSAYHLPLSFLDPFLSPAYLTYWITELDWADVYQASCQVTALLFCLLQESRRTNDQLYMDALHAALDWIDAHQHAGTGGYTLGRWTSSDELIFISRLLPIYFSIGRSVPRIERIIDYALLAQKFSGLFAGPGGWDAPANFGAIDTLSKLGLLTNYRSADLETALGFFERGLLKTWGRTQESGEARSYLYAGTLPAEWFRLLALALLGTRFPNLGVDGMNWRFFRAPAIGWHDIAAMKSKVLPTLGGSISSHE